MDRVLHFRSADLSVVAPYPSVHKCASQFEDSLLHCLPNMAVANMSHLIRLLVFCQISTALVANNPAPALTSVSFPVPSGYSIKVYNVSAATTTIKYHYSNEELALLWDQVGPISVGPITTTVSPTPEPSSYPRPGRYHPQVWPLYLFLPHLILINTGTNL